MNMQWLKALSEWNKFCIDSSAVIKKIMIDDAAHEKSAERGEERRHAALGIPLLRRFAAYYNVINN